MSLREIMAGSYFTGPRYERYLELHAAAHRPAAQIAAEKHRASALTQSLGGFSSDGFASEQALDSPRGGASERGSLPEITRAASPASREKELLV